MDDLDRQLLLFLQNGIPLQKKPFEGIAARLGLDSADVLLRISRLKLKKVIRQVTAVLEGRNLGYETALAAMVVKPEKLEGALFWINAHPGITHCLARDHEFNLWLTLALPAGMIEPQLRRLHTMTGAKKTILLPALKRFKGSGAGEFSSIGEKEIKETSFASAEIALLRRIQEDFPLHDEPFRKLAADAGISEPEIFGMLETWSRKGHLKKITALMPSKAAPPENSVLAVWEMPEERQDEVGERLIAFDEVLECVKRTAYPDFPYALYTVVRAGDPESAEMILRKMTGVVGSWPYRLLAGIQEYKKTRLKYFSEGLEDWHFRIPEAQNSGLKSSSNEE